MLEDHELDAIYEGRPTSENIYCNQLKKNIEQSATFVFDDIELFPDSKGNRNMSIRVKVLNPQITTDDDKTFTSGKFYLIFPKKTAAYMFADANIDIRKETNSIDIKFIIKSQKKYIITNKKNHNHDSIFD